ncbi:AMP-binding protein [Streptomyces sp. NPDC048665]|uniref:AMP-binding protein n=1 Tax=Streptomyces sp. NPDC048665 TaxID=3155490 RepID=UPI00342FAA11
MVPSAEVANRYREQGWWRDATFSDDLRTAALERPDAPALLTWRHLEDTLVTLSFGEFDARADAVAAALRELGVRRGEVVAYQLPAWWEAAVLAVACLRAGVVVAPMPLLFGPQEVERMLAATGAVACVVPDSWDGVEYGRRLAEQAGRLPALRHRIVIGDAAATAAESLQGAFSGERPATAPGEPLGADEVCALLLTSGTTGEPHLVAHSANTLHGGSLLSAPSEAERLHATSSGMTFIGGFSRALRATARRVPTLYSDSREAGCWLQLIERTGVTQLWTTPGSLRALTEEQQRRARDLSSLQAVRCSSGPLSPTLVAQARGTICPVVLSVWATTECGHVISTSADDPRHRAGHRLGRLRGAGEVRLEPDGRTRDTDAFQLYVRGPGVCLATIGRASRQVIWSPADDEGWLDTGDVVAPDEQGALWFIGRRAGRVGRAWQIPVADVEEALCSHPGVDDAVLLPWPDAEGGEVPCAVVVGSTPPDLGELRDHVAGLGFHESYLPVRVEHVSEFPRTELGKVSRRLLIDQLKDRARAAEELPPPSHGLENGSLPH